MLAEPRGMIAERSMCVKVSFPTHHASSASHSGQIACYAAAYGTTYVAVVEGFG